MKIKTALVATAITLCITSGNICMLLKYPNNIRFDKKYRTPKKLRHQKNNALTMSNTEKLIANLRKINFIKDDFFHIIKDQPDTVKELYIQKALIHDQKVLQCYFSGAFTELRKGILSEGIVSFNSEDISKLILFLSTLEHTLCKKPYIVDMNILLKNFDKRGAIHSMFNECNKSNGPHLDLVIERFHSEFTKEIAHHVSNAYAKAKRLD